MHKLTKLAIVLLLSFQVSFAQEKLTFDQLFINCIDKWVVFPMDKDSTWPFGFVYFDTQAGLTLQLEGKYRVDETGKYKAEKVANAMYKYRLRPTGTMVALLPEERFKELEVEERPDWLSIYNLDSSSARRLYSLGFAHNAWNECQKALAYLEATRAIDPKFKGLDVEQAFSHNCLGQYDKAIALLKKAVADDPQDPYINKEYIYSLLKSGDLEKALEVCKEAIKNLSDTRYHGENTYNLLYSFYEKKDKKNFKDWIGETRKWNKDNEKLMKSMDLMEKQMEL